MAKAKVVHSEDAAMIIFKGDRSSPEPSTGVIKFPGGHVEVSRTSEGKYWAHINVDDAANITDSRIDYDHQAWVETGGSIPEIPRHDHIEKMAILVDGPFKAAGD